MNQLIISASQLEAFDNQDGDGCPRQWWADKRLKLPRPPQTKSQAFGTAAHAVNERYLLADDLGRDKNGTPVDLYPQGWERVKERSGSIGVLTPQEQSLIKVLHGKLVEEGYIARWPDRQVEFEFGAIWNGQPMFPVIEYRGVKVGIVGYIDVLLPDEVLDWKTTKNMKYAKSANKLRKALQMLVYGRVLRTVYPSDAPVKLTHVTMEKNPDKPRVRRTSVTVTVEELEEGHRRVQRLACAMVDVALTFETEDRWFDVPGPRENSNACNKYGGCPRQMVCSGRHTVDYHKTILANAVSFGVTSPSVSNNSPHTRNTMSLLGDRAAQAQPAAPIVPPVGAPAIPQPVAPQAAPLPPWASPGCTSCSTGVHPGWNTAGSPCRICDGEQAAAGGFTSAHFVITPGENSQMQWQIKPEFVQHCPPGVPQAGVSIVPVTSPQALAQAQPVVQQYVEPGPGTTATPVVTLPVVGQETAPFVQPAAGVPMASPPVDAPAAPAAVTILPQGNEVEPAPIQALDQETVKPKGTRGRPTAGFTLYIGCRPAKASVIELEHVFRRLADEMGKVSNCDYWSLHPFKRRDRMSALAQQVAVYLGKSPVCVGSLSPDMVAFVDSLRPFASEVVCAEVRNLHDGQ